MSSERKYHRWWVCFFDPSSSGVLASLRWHTQSLRFLFVTIAHATDPFLFFFYLPHNFRNVCVAGKSFIPNSESMWKLPQVLNFLLFLDIAWVYSNWLFSIRLNFVYFVDFVVFDWWVIPVFCSLFVGWVLVGLKVCKLSFCWNLGLNI